MSTRKSTTSTARVVYTSPEGRVVVTRTEDADYILSVDNQPAGVYTTAHAAEQAGLVELEYRVRQERFAAADAAAYAAMRDMMRRADDASYGVADQAMDAALAARDFGAEDAPASDDAALAAHLVGELAEYADALDLAADARLALDMRAAYDAAPTVFVALATPRRSFIAHELPAFVEELRGLLAYLSDGSVWQSANGDIRLVQAPTRYAAALAGKAK